VWRTDRQTDRQTDGRTDRILITIRRLRIIGTYVFGWTQKAKLTQQSIIIQLEFHQRISVVQHGSQLCVESVHARSNFVVDWYDDIIVISYQTSHWSHRHRISQLHNKFHGHFATSLEYAISLTCWSNGCVCLLNHIYLTLTTLYHLKIPLLLIKIKRSKQKNAEQVDQINRSGIFEQCNVVSVR